MAILNIGYYLTNWDEDHIEIWEPKFPEDAEGTDESEYAPFYPLTHLGQPIGLCEYASRLAAAGSSTHVLLLHDNTSNENYGGIKEHHIDPKEEDFHELLLESREGQSRLTFAFTVETDALYEFVKARIEEKRIFSFPYHIERFTKDLRKFDHVTEPEQVTFDLRTTEAK